jgi:hypothetical protein
VDQQVDTALSRGTDNLEGVRAAAYLLQVLGMRPVWPGNEDRLKDHMIRARDILKRALEEEEKGRVAPWVRAPEVDASIRDQVEQLSSMIESSAPTG